MSRLGDRSTPDLIVLCLTAVVGLVVIGSAITLFYALLSPSHEAGIADVAKNVGELTNGLIALIIGYVGGRGAAGITNGKHKDGE